MFVEFMNKIDNKENALKLYKSSISLSYFFLILFSLLNGLFEFTLDNFWFYFGYLFEFFFLIISLILFLFSLKASLSLPFKENKKILLTNYIVFPLYIVLTFIYNYIYHLYFKGVHINFAYIIFYHIFLIFMIVFNHKSLNKKYPFLHHYKEEDYSNDLLIGVNKNKDYSLKDILKLRKFYNLIYYEFILNLDLISLGILFYKINNQNLLFYIWIILISVVSIIIFLLFFINNHKIKLFNYKFYIIYSLYFIFMISYYILSTLIVVNNFDFNRVEFVFLFYMGFLVGGVFFIVILHLIYPHYGIFFKHKIKELEDKEDNSIKEENIQS